MMQECKDRDPRPLNWEEIGNAMSEPEKLEFNKVMGAIDMPNDTVPDYDAWLFHKAYQSSQPEIDALTSQLQDEIIKVSLLESLTDDAVKAVNTLKAENEKLRKVEFLAQQECWNTSLTRFFKEYNTAVNQMLEPLRHITEVDMKLPD